MKKLTKLFVTSILSLSMIFAAAACGEAATTPTDPVNPTETTKETETIEKTEVEEVVEKVYADYSADAYKGLCYVDSVLPDRDCINGENFLLTQKWIHSELLQAGYVTSDIVYQDVEISKKMQTAVLTDEFKAGVILKDVTYTEITDTTRTQVKGISQNIIVTKQGKTNKQIIIGMHYDGTGTGDNGSGLALGLTTAMKFHDIETEYTLKFVFFTGEEYGLFGSKAYANSLTDEDVANTLYMINMDSLVCGDYCYLYGGVQDNETKTVTKTEAYDNAMAVASEIGLKFKSNPWTWGNLSPDDQDAGEENPSYASPSTGNWSDHAPFKNKGITYLYFEATNWEIPDYTGYGETYLIGMLMNTENDYLEYIEKYFPGRPEHHLSMFSQLLNQLLLQDNYGA